MNVFQLMKQLRKLPGDALVVTFAASDGYDEVLSAKSFDLCVRRPRRREIGVGEYVNGETKSRRAKKVSAVLIAPGVV